MSDTRPRDRKWRKSLSKFCSLALRHTPEAFDLQPDDDGFVRLADLLDVLQVHRRYHGATADDLREVVRTSDKQRFELRGEGEAGEEIRARYGHSFRSLRYEPAEPPARLLHGTGSEALAAIRAEGLKPMSRHYVHLTPDADMAEVVGRRHQGALVMLTVRADEAYAAGVEFHNPGPKIWLCQALPPEFIDFPDDDA